MTLYMHTPSDYIAILIRFPLGNVTCTLYVHVHIYNNQTMTGEKALCSYQMEGHYDSKF